MTDSCTEIHGGPWWGLVGVSTPCHLWPTLDFERVSLGSIWYWYTSALPRRCVIGMISSKSWNHRNCICIWLFWKQTFQLSTMFGGTHCCRKKIFFPSFATVLHHGPKSALAAAAASAEWPGWNWQWCNALNVQFSSNRSNSFLKYCLYSKHLKPTIR